MQNGGWGLDRVLAWQDENIGSTANGYLEGVQVQLIYGIPIGSPMYGLVSAKLCRGL